MSEPYSPPPSNPSPASYSAAPPPAYSASGQAGSGPVPGKTLGIVALVLSFFFQLLGLILGIVALVQSKKAGYKNGPALAAIIISSVLLVLGIIIAIIVISVGATAAAEYARLCGELGAGTHEHNGLTVTCE